MGPYESRGQHEPVSIRQPEVEQDGIRREPVGGIHGRRRAVGLPDNGVTTPLQQLARGLAEHGRVIDDEDTSRQMPIVGAQATLVKRSPRKFIPMRKVCVFHPLGVMCAARRTPKVGSTPVNARSNRMSTFLWILLAVLYLTALVSLGVSTLRKGHTVMFVVGIVFPILWIVGALMAPTPRAAGAA